MVVGLEAGNHIEQLFVDGVLAESVKIVPQGFQQFADVFLRRCMAAKRLAFSLANDSAQLRNSETNRYSRINASNTCSPFC
ncbi:hypothetical protein QNM99_20555 [Pseudomonas sp. PCH446]